MGLAYLEKSKPNYHRYFEPADILCLSFLVYWLVTSSSCSQSPLGPLNSHHILCKTLTGPVCEYIHPHQYEGCHGFPPLQTP